MTMANAPQPRRKAVSQEKIMILMSLIFFGGVAAYTLLPEGYRGITMTLLSALTFWVMFL
jgi:hypothetical protein